MNLHPLPYKMHRKEKKLFKRLKLITKLSSSSRSKSSLQNLRKESV